MAIEQVPFIDLQRMEDGFFDELLPEVENALRNTQFVGGPKTAALAKELSEYTGSPHVVPCANGTDALQLALRASGIGPGDKVLLPDSTFWASFEAIINVGAIPVAIDIDPETLHLSLKTCEAAIDRFKPKGLMLVHLYGWASPDTHAIRKLCEDQNIVLVEDSAQAMGVKIAPASNANAPESQWESIYQNAPLATTSFYPAKVLGASGDAGGVFTNAKSIRETIERLSNHGRIDHYRHGDVGWNSRVGVYESIFLLHSLKHLPERIESRRNTLEIYRQELKDTPVEVLSPATNVWENGYLNVCRVAQQDRDPLMNWLKEHNVGCGNVYPTPIHEQPGAAAHMPEQWTEGQSSLSSRRLLNLPCFAYMSEAEIAYVVETVKCYYRVSK